MGARVAVRARSLRCLSGGLRRGVRLQVPERAGQARVVRLDLQQRLVTADRVVEPGQAVARGEVGCGAALVRGRRSASGASVSVGSEASVSVSATEELGVGLPPWTPPVAALAIVPATMSMAPAIRTIRSGLRAQYRPNVPQTRLAKRPIRGRIGGTTQGAKSNAARPAAQAPGAPGARPPAACRRALPGGSGPPSQSITSSAKARLSG